MSLFNFLLGLVVLLVVVGDGSVKGVRQIDKIKASEIFDHSPATGVGLLGPGGGPALDSAGTVRREVLVEHGAVPVTIVRLVNCPFRYEVDRHTLPWCQGYRCPTRAWGSSSSHR